MNTSASNLHLTGLLNAQELAEIKRLSDEAAFEDGKLTATSVARDAKQNLQMSQQSRQYMPAQQIIMQALNRSDDFRNLLLPKNVYPFLFSKYTSGMSYGWHVDSPLMGNMMRTDIAMTIFLSDPSEYDGGALELQTAAGILEYKLAKGDAICYPCTYLHRVAEVTSGERRVAVTWLQSLVKDPAQRQIISELLEVQQQLLSADRQSKTAIALMQTRSNLLRMWSE